MDRSSIIRAFSKAVNRKHGCTMGLARNIASVDIPRLDTGSLSFNVALGGGIPVGRLTMFRGKYSSGKTTEALRVAANAQDLCANCLRPVDDFAVIESGVDDETGEVIYEAIGTCDCYSEGLFKPVPYPEEYSDRMKGTFKQIEIEVMDEKSGKMKKKKTTLYKERLKRYEENSYEPYRIVFFDFEGTLDLEWAERIGVDTRILLVDRPGTAEEGIDVYDELLRTGAVDLFLLDSIAAMTPSVEIEKSTEDGRTRAAQAILVNQFVRKITASANDCKKFYDRSVTQIWINQERDSMDPFNPKTMPGGHGQEFGASVIVSFWPSKWNSDAMDDDVKKDFQIQIGKEVRQNFKVEKSKVSTPKATGMFVMCISGAESGQIDEFKYVLDQGERYGLWHEEGKAPKKKWYLSDEEFTKKASLLARVREPEVFKSMKKELLRRMLEKIKGTAEGIEREAENAEG